MTEAIGTLLNGRYRLEAELGQGGMGRVYRAHDILLDRHVAVKVLSATALGTEGRARLLREARAAAGLNHPNIASAYDGSSFSAINSAFTNCVQFLHHLFISFGYTGLKTFGRRPVSCELINENKPVREANMMKRILRIGALVLIGVLVVGTVAVWALPANGAAASNGRQAAGRGAAVAEPVNANRGPAVANPVKAAPIENLTPGNLSEAEALQKALDDEYKAWATYEQVIADFGAVRPFTQIQKAEENHIGALVTLFERYGLEVPANGYAGSMPSFDTLAEACAAGAQAEIDNAALYDELFGMADNTDLTRVFTSLQQASQAKHLPAFERCAP